MKKMRRIVVSKGCEPICVEHILVALDKSSHSLAALQAAIELASHYHANLKGVFVEDINVLNLAKMPFRKEVGEYTATVREITQDGLSREISVQSRWVTRFFQNTINQTDVNADFAVLRGNIHEIVNIESQACDLVVIGKSGTHPLGRHRFGSTAKALIELHQKPLLLIEENTQLGSPIILMYENSPIGKISLETARDLMDPAETLMIFLIADDPDVFLKLNTELNQWAFENQIIISIESFKSQAVSRLIGMVERMKTGLFILPHNADSPQIKILESYLGEIRLPILLIR
jgi:nucleotide-binding universal stress UspA family protein